MTELPLPDYDHLPEGSLQHRIRSLTADELQRLIAYERAHAARAGVMTILEARLDQLRNGAEPSGGEHQLRPEVSDGTAHESPVSPRNQPEPAQPLRHGQAEQTPRRAR